MCLYLILCLSVRFIKVFGFWLKLLSVIVVVRNRDRNKTKQKMNSINVMAVIIRRIQWADCLEAHINGQTESGAPSIKSKKFINFHSAHNSVSVFLFIFFRLHFWILNSLQWLHLSYFLITCGILEDLYYCNW